MLRQTLKSTGAAVLAALLILTSGCTSEKVTESLPEASAPVSSEVAESAVALPLQNEEEETKKTTSAKKNSSGGVPMWVTFLLCVVSMGIGFGICYCVFVGFNDPDDVNPSKKGNEKKTPVRKTGKNLNTSSENRLNDDKDTDDAELDLFDDDDDDKDELL